MAAAQVLDEYLARREWIAQGKLTLADLAIAAPLMHTLAAELPVTGYANLQAWFARVQALEAWKKAAAGPLASWIALPRGHRCASLMADVLALPGSCRAHRFMNVLNKF